MQSYKCISICSILLKLSLQQFVLIIIYICMNYIFHTVASMFRGGFQNEKSEIKNTFANFLLLEAAETTERDIQPSDSWRNHRNDVLLDRGRSVKVT